MDQLRNAGPTREVQEGLSSFFRFIDDHVVAHHLKEEKVLFPLLQERRLEIGEHGAGPYQKTAIDVMEDDHIRVIQLAAKHITAGEFVELDGKLETFAAY